MNDLQIEYFLSAAQNLSYTKTANDKFVTQPAVSRQIAALEAELEVKLFEVGYKSIKLTKAGEIYFDYFKKHYEQLDIMKTKLKSNLKNNVHTIRVGCGSGWTLMDILPKIVGELKEEYGNVRVILENCAFSEVSHSLLEHEVDIGITLGNDALALPSLESRTLVELPRVIIYSPKLEIANKDELAPIDFRDEYFLVPRSQRSTFVFDLVKSFCDPYGFSPDICEVRNTESLINAVISGLGVAIVDYWTYVTLQNVCKAVYIDSRETVSVSWRRNNNNPLIESFLKSLEKNV